MRRDRLLRSTPVRLALTYGVFFVLASLAVSVASFMALRAELYTNLDVSVRETYSIVASSYEPQDAEDLVTTVKSFSRLREHEYWVFYLGGADGQKLAGNAERPPADTGLANVTALDLGLAGKGRFRVMRGDVAGQTLVVGQSFSETEDMAQIMLINFGWATALAILAALVIGIFLARRAQARLDRIAHTMNEVSNGRLDSRIRLVGRGDDIDVVSGQINAALDRLAALVEGMRQVSADIAHDLKTPLYRLRLSLEEAAALLARGVASPDQLEEALAESDRINATFEALLRIAQIETGARKKRFQTVDLAEIMETIVEIYADVAEDNGQFLSFSRHVAASALISGDRELLTQLFVNLVENAINHCAHGARISLTLGVEDDFLVAVVGDDGEGIPAAEREKIFQRLYRLDRSRTSPGNGLGLSLVRAIADLHGIAIHVEDNGPGARFVLAVPGVAAPA
ncbi:HAMP domain-containing histidine kinase [Martelella alba]|uniref:histidine kinase n=1 Tax=Martelella alba TaxID=2590451 RepID=A0A506UFM5_9HYPH|nr:HAMP domain-containing sensor histidine kinase [Martelella alba]TPW32608.1 HAMP domain-containing histidine kinase [Martelella alba]